MEHRLVTALTTQSMVPVHVTPLYSIMKVPKSNSLTEARPSRNIQSQATVRAAKSRARVRFKMAHLLKCLVPKLEVLCASTVAVTLMIVVGILFLAAVLYQVGCKTDKVEARSCFINRHRESRSLLEKSYLYLSFSGNTSVLRR